MTPNPADKSGNLFDIVEVFLADLEKIGGLKGVVPENVLSSLASAVSGLEYVEQMLGDDEDPSAPDATAEGRTMNVKRVYLVAFEVEAEDETALPDPVGFINGIHDGLPDEWFENIGDNYWIERIVTDAAWPLPDLST